MSKSKYYPKFENAIINGNNMIKDWKKKSNKKTVKRDWKDSITTGYVRIDKKGNNLIKVFDPNTNTVYKYREIDMSTFTGTIKIGNGIQIWKKGTKETIKNTIKEYKETIKTEFNCKNKELKDWTIDNMRKLAELIKKDNKPVKKRVTRKMTKKGILV